jgi:lipopolysaccharide export system protein LptC
MSKDVWDLSDDELEAAFQAAKAEMGSPDTAYEEEREEEHEAEDLEQPVDDEDSDDSADTDVSDETTNDEDSEAESDTPDGESADEDEEPETEEGEAQAEVQPIQKHKFKANGREYEFSDEEVREQFPKIFGQAMDYTKKMQALKPWRQSIDALESNGLSHEDVNLMIDVLKGDKDAVAAVLKRTGVDALELDVEQSRYVPKGINVKAYTPDGMLETEMNAKVAIHYTLGKNEKWKAYGNVVVKNYIKGETMETDTLYWDRANKKIYTNCLVRLQSPDLFMQGYGMESDEMARNAIILNPFDSYGVVQRDSTEIAYIDTVNFIGPLIPKKSK